MDFSEFSSDWEYILSLLPQDWRNKFNELQVLKFGRKFNGPDKEALFLRIMLMHLACGYSFRMTAAQAKSNKLIDVTDVTLFHHFEKCKEFFEWCNEQLLKDNRRNFHDLFSSGRTWKAVDGTVVKEQGCTGSLYRVHYSVYLDTLSADQFLITNSKIGESLARFQVTPGDVIVADRGFSKAPGIFHVTENGGDVLCRYAPSYLKLKTPNNKPLQLKTMLESLREGEIGDQEVSFEHEEKVVAGRICAVKRQQASIEVERKHIIRSAQLKGRKPSEETLFWCNYLLVFTTLKQSEISAQNVLRAYRLRWQIEVVFKRLKSLLELGQLHKHNDNSIKTFLAGKLLIALLIEKMISQAEDFSPF